MFNSIPTVPDMKNIVILHGELRDRSADGVIGLAEAADKDISYIALGHYHSYTCHTIPYGGEAVYCGIPEGRGFDEVGRGGYVLLDTDCVPMSHRFVPFAKRSVLHLEADISNTSDTYEVQRRTQAALSDCTADAIIRLDLVGGREINLRYDTSYLTDVFKSKYFYLEICDKSTLAIHAEDFRYDKTLKGEFIRLCFESGLNDNLKSKIIEAGLRALAGEEVEGK